MEAFARACAQFSAGHAVPGTAHEHPHGHVYTVRALVGGPIDARSGEVLGTTGVQEHLRDIVAELHLRELGKMLPASGQSPLNIASYIMDRLLGSYPRLVEVEVTDESGEGAVARREPR